MRHFPHSIQLTPSVHEIFRIPGLENRYSLHPRDFRLLRFDQAKLARARPEGEGGWQGCEVLGYMIFHHKRFIATLPADIADALGASKASVEGCLGQMLKAG